MLMLEELNQDSEAEEEEPVTLKGPIKFSGEVEKGMLMLQEPIQNQLSYHIMQLSFEVIITLI